MTVIEEFFMGWEEVYTHQQSGSQGLNVLVDTSRGKVVFQVPSASGLVNTELSLTEARYLAEALNQFTTLNPWLEKK